MGDTLLLATAHRAADSVSPGPTSQARNASLVFCPTGTCVARYGKSHLFRSTQGHQAYDDTRVLLPGDAPVMFALPSRDGHTWHIGLSGCCDPRFAALYRAYA